MNDSDSISLGNLLKFVQSMNALFGSDARIELAMTISSTERPEIVDVLESAFRAAKLPYRIIQDVPSGAPKALPAGEPAQQEVAKPQEVAAPAAKKPARAKFDLVRPCEHCKEPFHASRQDQKFCKKPECRAALRAIYDKRHQLKKQQTDGAAPAAPKSEPRPWVEQGDGGQRMTSREMSDALRFHHLKPGSEWTHLRQGHFRVNDAGKLVRIKD